MPTATEIYNYYLCGYLIDYIQENFKILDLDFQLIATKSICPDFIKKLYDRDFEIQLSKSLKKELGIL